MPTERFQFMSSEGHQLAAALDLPEGAPRAYALFAHCFTCGKDVLAARRIATALAARGIAVLRFDFTGLGSSEGDFANATFSSNVADLVRAADHLRETREAPAILIGHSLGGAAILAAAGQIPEARAVVTIAAPSDPIHVTGLFKESLEEIRAHGKSEVSLAGRPFQISREFLEDIAEHSLMATCRRAAQGAVGDARSIRRHRRHRQCHPHLRRGQASEEFRVAGGCRSSAEQEGRRALCRRCDRRLGRTLSRSRGIAAGRRSRRSAAPGRGARNPRNGKFQQTVAVGPHRMLADEPVAAGGEDTGPGPYDFLLAGLGACTSMTLRLYADRKSLPLERVTVTLKHSKIHAEDCTECETRTGMLDQIERAIAMEGALDAEQRRKLMEIADKCPVHRTLTSEVRIVTTAAD